MNVESNCDTFDTYLEITIFIKKNDLLCNIIYNFVFSFKSVEFIYISLHNFTIIIIILINLYNSFYRFAIYIKRIKFIMFLIASIIALFRYMYNLMLNIHAITLCKSSLNILLITFVCMILCVCLYCNQVHVTVFVMFFK